MKPLSGRIDEALEPFIRALNLLADVRYRNWTSTLLVRDVFSAEDLDILLVDGERAYKSLQRLVRECYREEAGDLKGFVSRLKKLAAELEGKVNG